MNSAVRKVYSLNVTECSLNVTECSLNATECSLDATECSLNATECSLNATECSLNATECSLNVHRMFPEQVWCGHEYTVANLLFAQTLEPGNGALLQKINWAKKQIAEGKFTVPSTIGVR